MFSRFVIKARHKNNRELECSATHFEQCDPFYTTSSFARFPPPILNAYTSLYDRVPLSCHPYTHLLSYQDTRAREGFIIHPRVTSSLSALFLASVYIYIRIYVLLYTHIYYDCYQSLCCYSFGRDRRIKSLLIRGTMMHCYLLFIFQYRH